MNQDIKKLKEYVEDWETPIPKLANELLGEPKFATWPGSILGHHNYPGGLAKHTREVFELGVDVADTLKRSCHIDLVEYFFAALYHDAGKLSDYVQEYPKKWKKGDHARHIHHITRSVLMWTHDVSNYPELYAQYHDKVVHAILSHHGRREWGSPVAPKTQVAWVLHLCDGLSARMEDWDKHDPTKDKK